MGIDPNTLPAVAGAGSQPQSTVGKAMEFLFGKQAADKGIINTLFGLGGGEIILILFVILLLFGAKKLPELAKGLGKGISEFKKASTEIKDEVEKAIDKESSEK